MSEDDHKFSTEAVIGDPARFPNQAMRIAFLAMAVVLVCVSFIAVMVALSAGRATSVADKATAANEALRVELACRATPALEYDRESSELQAMIATGLAAIADGEFNDPAAFAEEINEQVAIVQASLDAREKSLTDCAQP